MTAPGFCTPRMVIHICLHGSVSEMSIVLGFVKTYVASMTTATPRGFIASCTASATCFVSRS